MLTGAHFGGYIFSTVGSREGGNVLTGAQFGGYIFSTVGNRGGSFCCVVPSFLLLRK